MAEEYFINGAGSGLELDDDCDFLMDDCEDDGGLREVLHMFACSTPKLSGGGGLCLTNNGSPRSLRLYSPRSGSSLGMMSFQNAVHSPGTSKTLLTTPLSSATASTSSQTSGNINLSLLSNLEQHREASSPKRFFVAASSSSLPLPLPQGKNLPRQPLAQQHEPAKVAIDGRPKNSAMENKKRKITHYRGMSLNNLSNDYDIDLTGEHEKVNKTGGKAKFVSGFNKNEKRRGAPAEITPLSYLLNQPAIANTSNPAPCPFEYIASVAPREVKKAEEAQVEGAGAVDNSEDSEQQRVCRTEKSLYFLCKKFISRCRQIQEQQENTSVGTPVAMKELTTYLQVEKRRIHDIVNILSTITMLIPVPNARGEYMFRELMATEHFLGTLQEEALRLYPLQAMTAGLTGDDETDEPATAAGTIPNRLKSVPIRPTKKPAVQESLVMGLLGLFLVGYDRLALTDASRYMSPALLLSLPSEGDVPIPDAGGGTLGSASSTPPSLDNTRMKRLYDVANTLCGAGLLRKEETMLSKSASSLSTSNSGGGNAAGGADKCRSIMYRWQFGRSPTEIRKSFIASSRTMQSLSLSAPSLGVEAQ